MPEPDLLGITAGTVTAPAGCGKTHLIAEALKRHIGSKPILVLTHTNAGVAALRSKLDKASVPSKAYRLSTIDGWVMRLISTFPARSGHNPAILALQNAKTDYPAIREAAKELLKKKHLNDVLTASYSQLIVDEYQDCSLVQHAIIFYAAKALPTCVLGDPLQAIFNFHGTTHADWNKHVCTHFPVQGELDIPWRWNNAGEGALGTWLLEVRQRLLNGTPIDLTTAPTNVEWVQLNGTNDEQLKRRACLTAVPAGGKVLIIADSTNPAQQRLIASQTPGAVTAESVDLKDLISFAKTLNFTSPTLIQDIFDFAGSVMINVGAPVLGQRIASLRNGTARNPANDIEISALKFITAPSYAGIIDLLVEINKSGGVRSHRPAVLRGAIRMLQMSGTTECPTALDAAIKVREQSRLIGRPLAARTVGSTLLLKGLEAEVVVVLNPASMDKSHLYVALTRGAKKIVICSVTSTLTPA